MLLRVTSVLALAVLALVVAGQASAGTVLKTVNRDLASAREAVATSYAQAGALRVETGSSSGRVIIFKDDVIYALNPQQQTYMVLDRDSLRGAAQQLAPLVERMQAAMSMMTPEQRAELEKKFGIAGTKDKPVVETVRKTGRNDKVAGYVCSYSEVLRDDVVTTEACVAAPTALKGSDELLQSSAQVAAFFKQVTEGIELPWLRELGARQLANYAQLGGVPLVTRRFEAGKPVAEVTLQSIATEALPATLFAVPDGYTRQKLPLVQ